MLIDSLCHSHSLGIAAIDIDCYTIYIDSHRLIDIDISHYRLHINIDDRAPTIAYNYYLNPQW